MSETDMAGSSSGPPPSLLVSLFSLTLMCMDTIWTIWSATSRLSTRGSMVSGSKRKTEVLPRKGAGSFGCEYAVIWRPHDSASQLSTMLVNAMTKRFHLVRILELRKGQAAAPLSGGSRNAGEGKEEADGEDFDEGVVKERDGNVVGEKDNRRDGEV